MKQIERIPIRVSRPYEVLIGSGIIEDLPQRIGSVCDTRRVVIVTDDIVDGLFGDRIQRLLAGEGFEVYRFVFPNGEKSKNIRTLSDILEFSAQKNIRRNDALIALGGGVVGDIAGFAAAVYMRGIRVIQIPTTLLAMVDSSVGGKTAVDLRNGKNLAGAFWQPSLVLCDTDIAYRLPSRIFSEGMAEVIKCGLIRPLRILESIEEDTLNERLSEVIRDCISLKGGIVEQDEYDLKGIRNILNVGHTAAHAIEKLSGYRISHGTAVGTGMVIEAAMACSLGICSHETAERIRRAVLKYDLLCRIPQDARALVGAMRSDKKNRDRRIVFELPAEIGSCRETVLDDETVLIALSSTDKIFEG